MEQPALLEMRNITKEFPGVKALDGVSLTVRPGTVHALMGENGAGKSTLMKCLFGIYAKDEGTIVLDGKEVDFKNSKEALEGGVAMVHQELNQALTRSVMDNLWLGRYPKVAGIMVSEGIMRRRTGEVFDELDVRVDPKAIMSTLPVSQRQMVEIAKAVSYNAKVIVFDEPTSSLTEAEVEHLFRIINMLRQRGCGIIYISHKMDEILRISDEVTIMRRLHGKEIKNKSPREAIKNGFALLTEERRATGIFGIRDIKENTVISSLNNYLRGGICLSEKAMKKDTDWAIQAMHIKTPGQSTQIRSLSGGNQQKVIIGRWLLTAPEILLLDEPTRGIDVGAKYEIYQLILDLAKEGKGVIVVSSEMPELLGICDRILVMSNGILAGEVDARSTSQEEILTLAAKYV